MNCKITERVRLLIQSGVLPPIKPNWVIVWIRDPRVLALAYEFVKSKDGALTPGSTPETIQGFGITWLLKIRKTLKRGLFQFDPARRVLIPKPGKKEIRPLDVSGQKVVQIAITIALAVLWENEFSDSSHAYRLGRGINRALEMIRKLFENCPWVIEGDIKKCYESVRHKILIDLLRRKISCPKTLTLIERLLKSGHVDKEGKLHKRLQGIPQGTIVGPVLVNIYITEFDKFMNQLGSRNTGTGFSPNQTFWNGYWKCVGELSEARKQENKDEEKRILAKWEKLRLTPEHVYPAEKPKVVYIRYSDDFVIGVFGDERAVNQVKKQVSNFLHLNLGLRLRETKTFITRGSKYVQFLGFAILRKRNRWFIGRKGLTLPVKTKFEVHVSIDCALKRLHEKGIVKKISTGEYIPCRCRAKINLSHNDLVLYYNEVWEGFLSSKRLADRKKALFYICSLLHRSLA